MGNTVTLSWAAPNGGVTPTAPAEEGCRLAPCWPASHRRVDADNIVRTERDLLRPRPHDGRGDEGGGLERSAAARERAAPPAAPTGLLGLANGDQLTLTWRHGTGGSAATGVIIDVTGAASGSLSLALSDSFSFGGMPPGTYSFAVRAFNLSGSSGPSNTVTLTFPGSCAAPQTPVNFSATRAGNVISVSWAPALNGAAPTGFTLIVSGTYSLEVRIAGRSISAPVGPGTYTLSVAATNPCGTSPPTAAQTVTLS